MAVHESARRKLTYEDYLGFPEDGRRHEILDGEHSVSPSPGVKHQRTLKRLLTRLDAFVEENRLGEVWLAPTDVRLGVHDVVQPDLFFLSGTREAILTEQSLQGAPDLVIEVLSPRTRRLDEGLKRERYARAGVEEYWLVDPDRRTVRILRRTGGDLRLATSLSAEAGDVLTSPLFPGLEIPVRAIFQ